MDNPVVLILDDELMMLRVLERILRSPQYELVTASTIAKVRELLPQIGSRLKLAIIDQGLRDGKGTVFATELLARYAGLSVIIATGDSYDIRGFEVLLKPFEITTIRALVRSKIEVPFPE